MGKAMAFPVRFVAEGQSVQSTSRELDEDGVFVRCVEPPEVGERVLLRLYLPGVAGGDALEAQVTEASAEGFRARFAPLADETRAHIVAALAAGAGDEQAPVEPLVQAGENRRFLPRYLDRFRVTLAIGQERAQRETLNLSASGLFIETDAPPELDQIVQLILELPDGKPPAQVQGIVMRRVLPGQGGRAGAGVQFIGADDEFRDRLDAWLHQRGTQGA